MKSFKFSTVSTFYVSTKQEIKLIMLTKIMENNKNNAKEICGLNVNTGKQSMSRVMHQFINCALPAHFIMIRNCAGNGLTTPTY